MTERGEPIPHNTILEKSGLPCDSITTSNSIKKDKNQEEDVSTKPSSLIKDIILLDLCSNDSKDKGNFNADNQAFVSYNKPKKKKKQLNNKPPSREESERFFYYMTRDMRSNMDPNKSNQSSFNQVTHNNYMTNNCMTRASIYNPINPHFCQHLILNKNYKAFTLPNEFYKSQHNINYSYYQNEYGQMIGNLISNKPQIKDPTSFSLQLQKKLFKRDSD